MAGGRGGAVEDSEWSAWRPTEDGLAGARQIASHVAPTYRLPDGNQLVAILAGPLEFANLPAAIALRSSPQGGNVSLVEGDSVLYTLSGLGRLGAIATGKPSVERHLLLRREALELALYTFRYDRKIDLVAALLPTPPKQDPSQLMLFRREDLEPQLDVPLRATLSAPPPSVDEIDRADAARIERLTSRGLFRFSLQASQDGRALLVLDPLR